MAYVLAKSGSETEAPELTATETETETKTETETEMKKEASDGGYNSTDGSLTENDHASAAISR